MRRDIVYLIILKKAKTKKQLQVKIKLHNIFNFTIISMFRIHLFFIVKINRVFSYLNLNRCLNGTKIVDDKSDSCIHSLKNLT